MYRVFVSVYVYVHVSCMYMVCIVYVCFVLYVCAFYAQVCECVVQGREGTKLAKVWHDCRWGCSRFMSENSTL
jgi:hypothetical protein